MNKLYNKESYFILKLPFYTVSFSCCKRLLIIRISWKLSELLIKHLIAITSYDIQLRSIYEILSFNRETHSVSYILLQSNHVQTYCKLKAAKQ